MSDIEIIDARIRELPIISCIYFLFSFSAKSLPLVTNIPNVRIVAINVKRPCKNFKSPNCCGPRNLVLTTLIPIQITKPLAIERYREITCFILFFFSLFILKTFLIFIFDSTIASPYLSMLVGFLKYTHFDIILIMVKLTRTAPIIEIIIKPVIINQQTLYIFIVPT